MSRPLDEAAGAAIGIGGVESVAIFATRPGDEAGELELAGAAGIAGPPLDGLVAAVANPAHPIRRAVSEPGSAYDVRPMNPGGPALRSHLPIRTPGRATLGVLAVAHEAPLGPEGRAGLQSLADELAGVLAEVRRSAPTP
ncbi:MAG TPA: hypothetical protein VFI34_00360 [Candidatus Limnocylindrales bacterium]|nr:hypothetical protein [Candidatus Limnocylindrales bacterium]